MTWNIVYFINTKTGSVKYFKGRGVDVISNYSDMINWTMAGTLAVL